MFMQELLFTNLNGNKTKFIVQIIRVAIPDSEKVSHISSFRNLRATILRLICQTQTCANIELNKIGSS